MLLMMTDTRFSTPPQRKEEVKRLPEFSARKHIDWPDCVHRAVLHKASTLGHEPMVVLLLDQG